jgi:hypothetical protein
VTNAPDDLLAIRHYIMSRTGLDAASVGIAGDPAHASTGGYHEGNDDLFRVGRLNSDYSKRESARDRPGTNSASALDIGDFSRNGKTLRQLSNFLVARCSAGDPRTRDVREVIYTPDGSTVRRWDRLGVRTTGDSSHLYHTHLSFFRDSEGRRAQSDNILGLLTEFFEGGTAMDAGQEALVVEAASIIKFNIAGWLADLSRAEATRAAADEARDKAILAVVTALTDSVKAGGGGLDTAAVIARINDVAAAESTSMAAARAEIASLRQALAAADRAAGEAGAHAFDA